MDSPPHSPLLELPTDLLHNIFTHLDFRDVIAARRSCSTLASIGLDHFGDEVALVYNREKFKALTEIAQHPTFAKRMRSLFYIVDRFKEFTYEEWLEHRVTGEPLNTRKYLAEATGNEDNAGTDDRDGCPVTAAVEARAARLAAVPEQALKDGYRKFFAVCQDQTEIKEQDYDFTCLRSFFQGRCKIRDVVIAS